MTPFERISLVDAAAMLAQGTVQLVDIRDAASFNAAHVAGAVHLTNDTLTDFLDEADRSVPLLVMCYHGHSSQGAAAYLAGQGFDQVYSIDGGFEGWRLAHPWVSGASA